MIEHKWNDDRYYFKKTIEHDGDHCGDCRFSRSMICYFFGNLRKDSFNGKTKRHQRCLDAQE